MNQSTIIQSHTTTTRLLKVTHLLKVSSVAPLSNAQIRAGRKILKFLHLCIQRRQNLRAHLSLLISKSQVSSKLSSCYIERLYTTQFRIYAQYLVQVVIARSYRKYLVRKQLSQDVIPCCIYWSENHSNVLVSGRANANRDVRLVGNFTQRKWEVSAYLMIMSCLII